MKATKLIIIFTVLAIFVVIASREIEWSHKRGEIYPAFSTYRSDAEGTRAFFLLLKELDCQVLRIEEDLWTKKECELVFIINPSYPLAPFLWQAGCEDDSCSCDGGQHEDKEEAKEPSEGNKEKETKEKKKAFLESLRSKSRQKFINYISKGRTVVFFTERKHVNFLKAFGIKISSFDKDEVCVASPVPHALTKDVHETTFQSQNFIEVENKYSSSSFFLCNNKPCGIAQKIGEGNLIVLLAPEIISNGKITKKDNLRLLLNIVEEFGINKTIGFDEYHHGFTSSKNFTHLFVKYGMELIILHIFLLFLLFIWRAFPRFGTLKSTGKKIQPQYAELLSATANIYRKNTNRANAALVFAKYSLEELEEKGQRGMELREKLMKVLPEWMKGYLSLSPIECFEAETDKKLSWLEFMSVVKKINKIRKEYFYGKRFNIS
ncbi:MAG: hypothetical protein JW928_00610 [Candidatus Aureabacteria bacterium]|nr:hypothetical protein [Candidatus Auribacterota bacterium]